MKEKKARVEDALHATRAAVEEGIVAGGGVALLRARSSLTLKGDNPDQEAGIKIVLRAIEEPLRMIVTNAGEEASVVVNKVLEGKGNFGYNAANGTYGDMVEMGVLDPAKVTRSARSKARQRRLRALAPTPGPQETWPQETGVCIMRNARLSQNGVKFN